VRRVDELVDRIDEVASASCGWCSTPLDPAGGSLDFCTPGHQQMWQERHQEAERIAAYREAADQSPSDAVQYAGGTTGPGSFEDCDCGHGGHRLPTYAEFEAALMAIPLEILKAVPPHVVAGAVFLVAAGVPGRVKIAPIDVPEGSPLWRDVQVGVVTIRFHPAVPRQSWWRRVARTGRRR
jgi:hypothetical protein